MLGVDGGSIPMVRALAAWLLVTGAIVGPATSPRQVVESAVQRVLAVLEPAAPGPSTPEATPRAGEGRRHEIRRIAAELFDFDEMARRALSRAWAVRTPEERVEFVQLLAGVLERAYLGRLEAYGGERIVYLGETVDGAHATVRSRIVDERHVDTPLDYRLHRRHGHWRVYDVLIDHVSFVSSYRSELARVLAQEGYPALMERLRQQGGAPTEPVLPRAVAR
jgi:phospholipid transport system substrate-binding protein